MKMTLEENLRYTAEGLIEIVADDLFDGTFAPLDGEGTARPRKDFDEYVKATLDSIPTDDPEIDYIDTLLAYTFDLIDELRTDSWFY